MSDSYLYLLPIWIQILQLSLSKTKIQNTKYKIQNTKLLLPKNIKRVILSHVQKGKKPLFSPLVCIQMSDLYLYLLSICIQILQLSL